MFSTGLFSPCQDDQYWNYDDNSIHILDRAKAKKEAEEKAAAE